MLSAGVKESIRRRRRRPDGGRGSGRNGLRKLSGISDPNGTMARDGVTALDVGRRTGVAVAGTGDGFLVTVDLSDVS